MGQKYKLEELLRLRASPLVCKPDGLAPPEDWMGPLPDPNQRAKPPMTRGKTDDASTPHDTSNRRSGLFETRHIARTSSTVPEDIVLGPPKTSFASARTFNKQSDPADKSNKTPAENEDPKSEKYNFRDKFFKDKDSGERESQRRDSRFNNMNGRRGEKEDKEEWNTRQRRGFGQEDADRRPKRNGDRDRDLGGYENKERGENGFEVQRRGPDRDGNRFESRRLGAGRGRHEQSWLKDDAPQESGDANDEKPTMRTREWRRDRGGMPSGDREWTRGYKPEQDPEWMDAPDLEDTKQVHTQEDFQRWKERMKAGSTPSGEPKEAKNDVFEADKQETGTKADDGETVGKEEGGMSLNSMDKFFGLWNASAQVLETKPSEVAEEQKREPASARPAKAKASRFTSLFSPPAAEPSISEVEQQLPSNPTPPMQSVQQPEKHLQHVQHQAPANPDQQDFQLLLQKMLDGGMSGLGQPTGSAPAANPSEIKMSAPQKEQVKVSTTAISTRDMGFKPDGNYRESRPKSRNSGGLESLLGPRSPRESAAQNHNRDSDLLLRLMQQAQRPAPLTQPQPPSQTSAVHTPGILQMPDLMSRPQLISKPKPPPPASFFDDPAIANISRQPEGGEHREQLRRRPTGGPPPQGLYDDIPFHSSQHNQQHQPSNQPRPSQHQALPYGMPRHTGFDQQIPPPPWANPNNQLPPQHTSQHQHQPPHQQHHQQQQHQGPHIAPPPGIPNPPRTNNPFSSGPPLPFPGPMPQTHDNRPPSFTPRNPNPTGFGVSQGMPPPPGYMPGMNGPPPPGFPPVPNAHEPGMIGMPGVGGQFSGNANIPGAGGPLPRHLLEMFGQDGRGAMHGHYR